MSTEIPGYLREVLSTDEPDHSYFTEEAAPEVVIINNSDPSEPSVVVNVKKLVVNLGS